MAYDNKFLPFASGAGANVQSDADYSADAERTVGNQPGVARSEFVNKSLKQACNFAYLMADVIANQNAASLSDSETTANFYDYFLKSVVKSIQNPIASTNIISPTTSGNANYYAISLDSVSDETLGDGADVSWFPRIFCLSGLAGNNKNEVWLTIDVAGSSSSYRMRMPGGETYIPLNTFGSIPQLYIFCMLEVSGAYCAFLLNPPSWAYQGGTGRKVSLNSSASVTVSTSEPSAPTANAVTPLAATNAAYIAEVHLELSAVGGNCSAAVKLFQNDSYNTVFGTLPTSSSAYSIESGGNEYVTFSMLPGESFEVFDTSGGTAPTVKYTSIVRTK